MASLESCIREDLNETRRAAMAVIDPVKLVIENTRRVSEMVTMPNHPNKPEMGSREVPLAVDLDRSAQISAKRTNSTKRLVMGKRCVCVMPTSLKRSA